MSAIKDLYDLSKELKESISDTKTLSMVMPMLDKIHDVERENLQMEREKIDLETKHQEEKKQLSLAHSIEVSSLQNKISELESKVNTKKPIGMLTVGR